MQKRRRRRTTYAPRRTCFCLTKEKTNKKTVALHVMCCVLCVCTKMMGITRRKNTRSLQQSKIARKHTQHKHNTHTHTLHTATPTKLVNFFLLSVAKCVFFECLFELYGDGLFA
jgi:hypothetical protein